MNKKVLIAWSGGLDSTYMIQYYLEQGYTVDVVTCNLGNAWPTQMKREQAAIKKMMKGYFKDKPVRLLGSSHIKFDGNCFGTLALSQVPVWLFNLVTYLQHDHTEVAIGYVMNDDAMSYLDDVRAIWSAYSGLLFRELPPIVFPLVKYKKTMIHDRLHIDLRKHVTWCESPEKEDQCGTCPSCKKMVDACLQVPPPKKTFIELAEAMAEEETRC